VKKTLRKVQKRLSATSDGRCCVRHAAYNGGTAFIGDDARLAFVAADGTVGPFPGPPIKGLAHVEMMELMTFEMQAACVPVKRSNVGCVIVA